MVTEHAAGVEEIIRDKTVLITGGGGSIGSELARQVFALGPRRLILVDRAESPLYLIQRDLETQRSHKKGSGELRIHLANVASRAAMERLVAAEAPNVIFHAAAYKHVPMMEEHPSDATHVNIGGTMVMLDAAAAAGVERFVFVSTDKAVRPSSVMGASKRIAEMLVADAARRTGRPYVSVRFGNVLGSTGSVVPIFQDQLENGEPLTITHPDMTRFFMTIPEASWLILDAAALGRDGDLFVLDMGEPVRIMDLARDLVRLAGRDPESQPIETVGLRPGEKLHEELFYDAELVEPTASAKVLWARTWPLSRTSAWRPDLPAWQSDPTTSGDPAHPAAMPAPRPRQKAPDEAALPSDSGGDATSIGPGPPRPTRAGPSSRRPAPPGPVLCVAPAGSGKTTTLVARVAWLIDSGVDPATIAAITFNKRAAEELEERLVAAIEPLGVTAGDRARADVPRAGPGDPGGRRRRRRTARGSARRSSDGSHPAPGRGAGAGSTTPSRGSSSTCGSRRRTSQPIPSPGQTGALFVAYEAALSAMGGLDFDDLVSTGLRVLETTPDVLGRWRVRCAHLLVDEVQDVDRSQLRLRCSSPRRPTGSSSSATTTSPSTAGDSPTSGASSSSTATCRVSGGSTSSRTTAVPPPSWSGPSGSSSTTRSASRRRSERDRTPPGA